MNEEQLKEAAIGEAYCRFPDDPGATAFSSVGYSASAMRHAFIQGMQFALCSGTVAAPKAP